MECLVRLIGVLLISNEDCDQRYEYLSPQIINSPVFGVEAYWREFAHLGAIGWTRDDGSIYWGCGGSLIWENFVLTAAHCVFNSDFKNSLPTVVRFGDLNLYNDTDDQFVQQYSIVKIIRHPEHRFIAKYHDIALLKLEKNIELHGTVVPACLWDDEEVRFTTLESAGWGTTGFGESQTPTLLKVALHPIDKSVCDRHYRAGDRGLKQGLKDYQLCAGDATMNTCQGDSGGPLEIKLLHTIYITPFIVAVTSFGSLCGKASPGVYTKVAPYIPWIRSVLEGQGEDAPDGNFTALLAKVTALAAVNCTLPKQFQPLLTKGLAEEHLCFGSDIFLVPEACEQSLGGGVQSTFLVDRAKHTVYALNLLGRDCGFGEPAIGVKISSHAQWLSQILLKNKRRSVESVLFYDADLELGDHCGLPDGTIGMCTDIRRCPKVQYDLNIQKAVTFCSTGTIVCCPFHNVLNATEGAGSELDTCSSLFRFADEQNHLSYAERDIKKRFPHVVKIQWILHHGLIKSCIGTLITQSVVVSSANCLSRIGNKTAELILDWETKSPQMSIEKIIIHPRYDASTLRNDIGLVKIGGTIESKSGTIPTCVWRNQTHTPLFLQQVRLSGNGIYQAGGMLK
ncbi:tryptase, putative [Anopheles sinensis]|uniref:Tryptase, putative n=1 Tax=Anopheles sinensis TaxID=74873 RepID=A0A084WH34_ANOSI|nr:tryptase, putative [Anopheles sinensis]